MNQKIRTFTYSLTILNDHNFSVKSNKKDTDESLSKGY